MPFFSHRYGPGSFYQPALKFQGYCTWDDFGNIMDQELCWKEIISQTAWFFFNFAILKIWHAFPRNEQNRLNLHSKNTFPQKQFPIFVFLEKTKKFPTKIRNTAIGNSFQRNL